MPKYGSPEQDDRRIERIALTVLVVVALVVGAGVGIAVYRGLGG